MAFSLFRFLSECQTSRIRGRECSALTTFASGTVWAPNGRREGKREWKLSSGKTKKENAEEEEEKKNW